MSIDLTQEIRNQLTAAPFLFKERGDYLREGICPKCGEKELWTRVDKPYYIKCPRQNECGEEWNIKDFLPDLFTNLNERYPATDDNPNQTADMYLARVRGLNIEEMHGWYEQAHFWKATANKGTATARFYLKADKSIYWERFIEEVIITDTKTGKPKKRKMDFGPFPVSVNGLWWKPPTLTIKDNSEVILTEGIIDALSLYQNGHAAVAIMSSLFFPEESIKPYLGKGITWLIGLDNDTAGRKNIDRLAERLRGMKEKVSAVLASEDHEKVDWNDLHIAKKLSAKNLKAYRILGQIALAQSKEERAFYVFLQSNEKKKHHVIDFKNSTYRVNVNMDDYNEESTLLDEREEKILAKKLQAF